MSTNNSQTRLQSLDALRGFDMLFIMGFSWFISTVCRLWPCTFTDAVATSMGHPEWNGFTHHDTIFPLFLFIAGISFPFSWAKHRQNDMSRGKMYAKILRRVVFLIVLGWVYGGIFRLDFEHMRYVSVLGRIGVAWGIAAVLYMNAGCRTRILIAALILIGYGLVSVFVGAPDVANADPLSFEGNFAGYFDRKFLPGRLYRGTFDPEGLFSTIPSIVTAMLGMFTGEFIRRENLSGERKTGLLILAALAFLVVGLSFSPVLPLNKSLWSSTFVCVVGSYSLAMFALFYYLIEVRGWHRWAFAFRVIGLNSITIYLAQRIVNFGHISDFFLKGIASKCPEIVAPVILSAGYVTACWLFLYFLYRKRTFLKV